MNVQSLFMSVHPTSLGHSVLVNINHIACVGSDSGKSSDGAVIRLSCGSEWALHETVEAILVKMVEAEEGPLPGFTQGG